MNDLDALNRGRHRDPSGLSCAIVAVLSLGMLALSGVITIYALTVF